MTPRYLRELEVMRRRLIEDGCTPEDAVYGILMHDRTARRRMKAQPRGLRRGNPSPIVRAACEVTGVPHERLNDRPAHADVVRARWLAVELLVAYGGWSEAAAGRVVGLSRGAAGFGRVRFRAEGRMDLFDRAVELLDGAQERSAA